MVAQPDYTLMSVEDYLAHEQGSRIKHEFVDGHVYAMAGGTLDHDRIANNIRAAIDAQLGDGPWVVFGPDLRVRVSPTVYYYPDAFVICDTTLIIGTAVEVTAPRLVVGVLSKATEADDRGEKFANYQTIPTLAEYLLVDSRRRAVERFRRTDDGLWLYQRHAPDGDVTLESIGISIPIATLYRRTGL